MRVSEGLLDTTECSPPHPQPLSRVGERRAEVLRRVQQTGPGLAGGSTIWAIAVFLRWIESHESITQTSNYDVCATDRLGPLAATAAQPTRQMDDGQGASILRSPAAGETARIAIELYGRRACHSALSPSARGMTRE